MERKTISKRFALESPRRVNQATKMRFLWIFIICLSSFKQSESVWWWVCYVVILPWFWWIFAACLFKYPHCMALKLDWFSLTFFRTLGTHTTLSTDPAKKAALLCFTTPQLNTKQRDICRRHPTLMASVAKGAREAVEECQIQFRLRRWNCSSVPESGTLFDPILKRGKSGLHWEHYLWLT